MSLPDAKPKTGSIAVALFGAVFGSMAGASAYLGYWLTIDGARTADQALYHIRWTAWMDGTLSWFVIIGAILGFAALGRVVGNRAAIQVGRTMGRILSALIGILVGVAGAVIAYLGFWLAQNPTQPFAAALWHLPVAAADPFDPLRAFLLGGALTGLVVGLYVRGPSATHRATRVVTGAVIGGVAGLVMYAVAFVLIRYPQIPEGSEYAIHFAEAVYSASPVEYGIIGLGAAVGVATCRYSWRIYGTFTLTALLAVVIGYLLYTTTVTLPHVAPDRLWLSLVLFGAEVVSLTMVVLYSFYTIDVATRKRWDRAPEHARFSEYYTPKVALHVPTYNEPPEVVVGCLKSLLAIDYPEDRFIIMVADDSTKPESSEPVRQFCKESGIPYRHRTDRHGYKAGALNQLLRRTPEDVELVAIIDADYQVEPNFLRETVGYFIDPKLAWVQTPQDYRNADQSFLTAQYDLADKYFYRTILPSRNEGNSIIFCGTMGILRREALVGVGGWGETYITEDAELSVRLMAAEWASLYVNKTYGRGLIPPTFEGYKRQLSRWSFGGGQILRRHFFDIFLGRFTNRQRFDFFIGNMHWFEGFFILTIASVILLMAWGDLAGDPVLTHHSNEVFLIGLVPFFLLIDGFTRLHMVLSRSLTVKLGGTLRVLGMWFSVKFSNSFCAFKGLLGIRMPFARTPKGEEGRVGSAEAILRSLRVTKFETLMALTTLTTAGAVILKATEPTAHGDAVLVTRAFLALWLLYYSLLFLSAPLYAYRSYASYQPTAAPRSLATKLRSVPQ